MRSVADRVRSGLGFDYKGVAEGDFGSEGTAPDANGGNSSIDGCIEPQ